MGMNLHHFLVWFQLWWLSCDPEVSLPQYMIWALSGIVFHFTSNGDGHNLIQRLYYHNIWYGHHQALDFISHPTVMVIISFRDHILTIYNMGIIRHWFSFCISCISLWMILPLDVKWNPMLDDAHIIYRENIVVRLAYVIHLPYPYHLAFVQYLSLSLVPRSLSFSQSYARLNFASVCLFVSDLFSYLVFPIRRHNPIGFQ